MKVDAVWRYPVKSMAGERVASAALTLAGVDGDRIVQVYDRHERVVTARRFPKLLLLHATLGADGEPLVDGVPWQSAETERRVVDAVGAGAHLRRFDGPERFDVLPLLVCTAGAVAKFGRDARRLRPNLVVSGEPPDVEQSWPGSVLRLPHADIWIADLRARCVMTTFDPDTAEQDPAVLRDIVKQFGGRLCFDAAVSRAGFVDVGEEARHVR
jgi:uncharacterized protein YcbX